MSFVSREKDLGIRLPVCVISLACASELGSTPDLRLGTHWHDGAGRSAASFSLVALATEEEQLDAPADTSGDDQMQERRKDQMRELTQW